MKNIIISKEKKAQSAIEYMLLLTTVVAIVLIGFKTYIPGFEETANIYYNRVVPGILGNAPKCGDGVCEGKERPSCTIDCPP